MNAQQADTMLSWFNCTFWGYTVTEKDLDVIENILLPVLEDNHEHVNGTDETYTFHEVYVHWKHFKLPEYRKDLLEDCE